MKLASLLLLACALAATAAEPPTKAEVMGWSRELADESAVKRDEAQARLEELGIEWKATLQEAHAAATDPEAKTRLERLIHRLTVPHWRTDIDVALSEAKAHDKPLLVLATAGAPDGFS